MCHPKGRSAAKDACSALTRRPARSYSAPTIPATVRYTRRRSGERHERSIPRPPALPAPLADPPIAPQPTHTRLRRARCTGLAKRVERLEHDCGKTTDSVAALRDHIKELRDSNGVLKGHSSAALFIINSLVGVLQQDVSRLGDRLHDRVRDHIANLWQRGGNRAPADVIAARDEILRGILAALKEREDGAMRASEAARDLEP